MSRVEADGPKYTTQNNKVSKARYKNMRQNGSTRNRQVVQNSRGQFETKVSKTLSLRMGQSSKESNRWNRTETMGNRCN